MATEFLVEAVRALIERRQQKVAELQAIDAALEAIRVALTPIVIHDMDLGGVWEFQTQADAEEFRRLTAPAPSTPPVEPPSVDETKTCETCGVAFTPEPGSAGRFCGRPCYTGNETVEQRRARLLAILQGGARWPGALAKALGMSKGTIYGDLRALSASGLIENTDDGWRIKPPRVERTAPIVAGPSAAPTPNDGPEYETVWHGGEGLSSYQQRPRS